MGSPTKFFILMPQHKSALKRVRQNEKRRERNRLHRARMRTMIKRLQDTTDPEEARSLLTETKSYLDQLTCKGIIHQNKAANTKSRLERHVNELG